MTANFLHPRNDPPPDETVDQDTPYCEICGSLMWLTKVETTVAAHGIEARKSFECKNCGAMQWRSEQRTDPLPNF